MVASGDEVDAGQPIAMISIPQKTADGKSVLLEANETAQKQLALIEKRIASANKAHREALLSMESTISFGQQSLTQTRTQIAHATNRLRIQKERFNNLMRLFGDGAIARNDLDAQEEQVILLKQQIAELRVREQQQGSAYGLPVPLQPGMTISADIVLEERSLLSRLFEPIISSCFYWWGRTRCH